MKTFIATILLFFAITSQMGTFAVYLIQQELIKEDMARQVASQLPNSELIKIQDSKNIAWEEEGKEFYVDHQFYDVVKTEKINGVVWYYCINDKMQTKLYNHYAKSIQSNTMNAPNQKENKQQIKFPTSYFLVVTYCIPSFKQIFSTTHSFVYEEKLSTTYSAILVPPPQQI